MKSKEIETRFDEYVTLVQKLKIIINASQTRTIQEVPDSLFLDNINFFVKAYLVSLCTILEAFLKDLALIHTTAVMHRMAVAKIPHNVVHWNLIKELKEKDLKFGDFALSITGKALSDELSGNPAKTINLFKFIGIDLLASDSFKMHKDFVGTIVDKRNKIIHHNDNAADVSMNDLLSYADHFSKYMKAVAECVDNKMV